MLVATATVLGFVAGVLHTELPSRTAYFSAWTRAWDIAGRAPDRPGRERVAA